MENGEKKPLPTQQRDSRKDDDYHVDLTPIAKFVDHITDRVGMMLERFWRYGFRFGVLACGVALVFKALFGG